MVPEGKNTSTNRALNYGAILSVVAIIGLGISIFYANKVQRELRTEIIILQTRSDVLETQADELNNRIVKLNEESQEMRYDFLMKKLSGIVDFSASNIQEIENGFLLVKAEQEEHLTGIRFKGRIINAQSISHKSAEFKLTASGKSKEFSINQISAGSSAEFTVYIPEIKAADAQYARIEYVSSSVSYYTK